MKCLAHFIIYLLKNKLKEFKMKSSSNILTAEYINFLYAIPTRIHTI